VAGVSAHDAHLMAQAANQVSSAVDQVRSLQSNLASAHDSMMGGWVGPAASTFTNAFTVFNGDFSKVIAALENLGQKLQQSGVNYTAVEQANQTSSNKIASALSG
jgi:WXG100 family type VII secretion target